MDLSRRTVVLLAVVALVLGAGVAVDGARQKDRAVDWGASDDYS